MLSLLCACGRFKTKACLRWRESGRCTYGSRCHFLHGEDDSELDKALNALIFDEHGEFRPDAKEHLDFAEARLKQHKRREGAGPSGAA